MSDIKGKAKFESVGRWSVFRWGTVEAKRLRGAFVDGVNWVLNHPPSEAEIEAVASFYAESEDTGSVKTAREALIIAQKIRAGNG